jgi:predicted nucleic acid-binding protein
MHADRFTVVLDANVLANVLARNMILSLAEAGLFRPRWSPVILEETEKTLAKITGGEEVAKRQRGRIERAFEGGMVRGFEPLIDCIHLPGDPNDRHVVAAAITTKASVIVTENVKHFPAAVLSQFEIEALTIDDFIADVIDLSESEAVSALKRMRERFKNPALTPTALIEKMERAGWIQTADMLIRFIDNL